ncbi:MAG TPA: outer membrane protein assembly factor BamA [Bacteroidales bacterium]|nr:outer membrane protein assembly factor BamA [Bacteroidales bacterium]
MLKHFFSILLLTFIGINFGKAQNFIDKLDYASPGTYEIADVQVTGVKYLNRDILVQLTGLTIGSKIELPGDAITKAVEKLWEQGLFSDVKINALKTEAGKIWLEIELKEQHRLATVNWINVKKSDQESLLEKLNLLRGNQVTDDLVIKSKRIIRNYYVEKGFFKTDVSIYSKEDTMLQNTVNMFIEVDKKERVRIEDIQVEGNTVFSDAKVRRYLKDTKKKRWYGLFKPSKYIEDKWEADKENLIAKYHEKGYRDVQIERDSMYDFASNRLFIMLNISEGNPYYFRKIKWVGNTKYATQDLVTRLGITHGDVYDQSYLSKRLVAADDAVGNLYLDNGYLFYRCEPVETRIEGDSVDIELRIIEGPQASINEIIIKGNTRTNDHVIRREIKTRPGELFSKSDIVRTVRELAQLGHFDPEKIVPNPIPNQNDGTVDLEYGLEERANDQIELSGGWGANQIVGTLGLKLSNFSVANLFNGKAWRPVPMGDGQTLSIRAQSNGKQYQSYSLSFTEPWLTGKKPISLSFSLFESIFSYGTSTDLDITNAQLNKYISTSDKLFDSKDGIERITNIDLMRAVRNGYIEEMHQVIGATGANIMVTTGATLGLGTRLKWPDDYFTLYGELSYENYLLYQWPYFTDLFQTGVANNFSLKTVFGRNSVDNPLYARSGSNVSLTLEITPPYSLFSNKNYDEISVQEKYKWVEFHKWKFKSDWYTRIWKDLVLRTNVEFGMLAHYNDEIGPSPFGSFILGGDGMSGYNYSGAENIALRGYSNQSLKPSKGGNIYNKYTMELRYLISPNPSATIYALAFLEAGNSWYSFQDFNPFKVNRAAGVGVRIFLPMLGLMGVDYGYGFDPTSSNNPEDYKHQFHLMLGQQF